jgi:hypothetical protein
MKAVDYVVSNEVHLSRKRDAAERLSVAQKEGAALHAQLMGS